MGWGELMGWLDVMRKQTEPRKVAVDSWEGASEDAQWQEMRRIREEARGR